MHFSRFFYLSTTLNRACVSLNLRRYETNTVDKFNSNGSSLQKEKKKFRYI